MNQQRHVIIGIDPGTLKTGYGIIEVSGAIYRAIDYGCIVPPAKEKLSQRYLIIFESLCTLLQHHLPTALSVETQYVHKNVQSALKLGQARGLAILAAKQQGIAIYEYAPSKAKKAVVGKGSASKEQVQAMVQMLLQLKAPPHPHDAADALALALCHAHHLRFNTFAGEEI
jgi:crossover junction endodeoxyribonuclease RuvC